MGCVYKVTNIINGKIYVGKTKYDHITRFNGHCKDALIGGSNFAFHASIRKYGKENFKVECLAKSESEKKLLTLEIFYIKKFNCTVDTKLGYNMTLGGESGIQTDVVKKKIGDANRLRIYSEETKKKISDGNKGKVWSEERKKEWSNRLTGSGNPMFGKNRQPTMLGKKHSKKTKEKLRKLRLGKLSSGENNGMFGRVRINNGIINKTIKKGDILPKGFKLGMIYKNK
jgi:group I intron endonuclease